MADKVIGAKLTVDGSQATQSVGNFKKELRDAQKEVIGLSEKFGATSKEAIAAAQKVAKLKDAIGDAKALSDAFNPDAKFNAFAGAIQGAVSGFSALQGAQALFGSESEELNKILLKVQAAMALSQGLNGILAAKDAFSFKLILLDSVTVSTFLRYGNSIELVSAYFTRLNNVSYKSAWSSKAPVIAPHVAPPPPVPTLSFIL